jgi:FMN phosphatase YigB (HAD superfamily)
MVGDSLEADIFGAKSLGMQTIWLTRRAEYTADEMQRIQPDFSMSDLNGLFSILEQINLTRR